MGEPGADGRGRGGEADAVLPVQARVAFGEGGVGFGDGAFVGGAEGIEGLALELLAVIVEECADYGGFFMPPYGEADEYGVDGRTVDVDGFDCGPEGLVEVFACAARLFVLPVDVFGGIWLPGHEADEFRAGGFRQGFCGELGIARVSEVDDYGFHVVFVLGMLFISNDFLIVRFVG